MVWSVWLLSRRLAPAGWGLVAPVVVAFGVWMELGSKLMTEAVAFPAIVWSATLLVLSLWRRDWRIFAAATGLAVLATLMRPQAGAMLLAIPAALALETLRHPRDRRRGLVRSMRREWLIGGGVLLLVLLMTGPGRPLLGDYGSVLEMKPSFWASIRWSGGHAIEAMAMGGIVAWLCTWALVFSRPAWRDARLGPFLAVLLPVVVVFIAVAGVFAAGESSRIIERYIAYIGPLMAVALVPALLRCSVRDFVAATCVSVAVALVAYDPVRNGGEAAALNGFGHDVLGWSASPSASHTVSLIGVVLVVGGLLGVVARLRGQQGRWWVFVSTTVAVFLLAALLVPSRALWSRDHRLSSLIEQAFGRTPDRLKIPGNGSATIVTYGVQPPYLLWLEFFNKRLDRAVVQPVGQEGASAGYGPMCAFDLKDDGEFTDASRCQRAGRAYVWLSLPPSVPTMYDGTGTRPAGVPYAYSLSGAPRLRALREPLCDDSSGACQPARIMTFPERPASLALHFVGGQSDHDVSITGRVHRVPAGGDVLLRIPVPAGRSTTTVQPDWTQLSLDVPELRSVTLTEAGGAPVRLN